MPPEGPRHPAAETPGQPSWIAPVKPVVPDHELLKRIGGGSYGDVWLARSVVGTWRAVKVVFRDRFLDARPYEREFKGMQKFEPLSRSNEGFIDILQIGRNDAEGYFYYVMELADDAAPEAKSNQSSVIGNQSIGPEARQPLNTDHCSLNTVLEPTTYVPKTLAKALFQRGRLPVSECLELGITLNLALAHLHNAGLIHRDIKPSNLIFVGGVPKLADIGLVIEFAEARSYVGTEGFIPPEGPNSPQADLYSLGKVLYEAGMGKDRKDFPEPLTQLVEAPDAPELLEFNAILLKACAANVKDRYQSAEEMNADLALLQSGGSVRKQRTLTRRLRFVQRAGAAVTALATLIALGWLWQARETHLVRDLANEKTRLAEENRKRVVQLDVANGIRLLDDNDPSAALLWFGDALPLVTNNPTAAEIHRIRIQQTLNHTPRLLHVFAESNSILTSAFSPDGNRIATSNHRGRVTLRDAKSGEVLWERLHEGKALLQLRFARDGRRLWVCTSAAQAMAPTELPPEFQVAELLDVQTGKSLFSQPTSNLVCSAFSPDDRWLALASTNYVIQLLDTSNGQLAVEMHGHTNVITMLAFSDDGGLLVSGSRDRTARIWRLPTGELVGRPFAHEQSVRRVALSPDARHFATATYESDDPKDSRVHVWDVQNATRVGAPITEHGALRMLMFSPDSKALFTSGQEALAERRFVRIWNVVPGPGLNLQRKLAFPSVRCWDFSPDGRLLTLGIDSGYVSIWSTETWELLFPPIRHIGWVESAHFSPDGARLLTTSDDGTAKVWTLGQFTETVRLLLPASHLDAPADNACPRGRTPGPIPVQLADGWLHLVDPDQLVEIQTLKLRQANDRMSGWLAGSTGRYWALDSVPFNDEQVGEFTLWIRQAGAFRCLVLPQPQPVLAAQFIADDSLLAAWTSDGVVRFWRTSDGTIQQTIQVSKSLKHLPPGILLEPFDRDGRTLLTLQLDDESGRTGHLDLFDLITGRLAGKHIVISGGVSKIRASPDGKRIARVGDDQQGTISDLQTGELAVPQFKHGGTLLDLDWSPDSRRLITAGLSGEVKLWDAATGEMLLSPMNVGDSAALSARWSADGRFIVTRCDDNQARVWDASTTEAITPFLAHSGYILWVCITPGNRLITASDPNLLRAWDLKPTPLAPDIIADYAKFLSGRRLSAGGVLLPIPAKELAELAQSLRLRAPQLFE